MFLNLTKDLSLKILNNTFMIQKNGLGFLPRFSLLIVGGAVCLLLCQNSFLSSSKIKTPFLNAAGGKEGDCCCSNHHLLVFLKQCTNRMFFIFTKSETT